MRKSIPLLCGAFFVLISSGFVLPSHVQAEKDPFGKMNIEAVSKKLGQQDFHVFDANGRSTFLSGHVPGAKHVHFLKYESSELPKNKEATLLFYCQNEF